MSNEIKLKFCGAAKTVTGSCYLLEINDQKILIDLGLFQGIDVFPLNYEEFEFNPKEIDAILLTHGHIDHSGLIPKAVKEGFVGEIYMTIPTYHIVDNLLMDSANVQEKNEKFKKVPAIYQLEDSLATLTQIHPVPFDKEFSIGETKIIFRKASHILGAASIEIKTQDKKIIFSGDLGRSNPTIIEGYGEISKDIDYVIMESLYGDRIHPLRSVALEKLLDVIKRTLARNGNVIIPAFALHRSQELLYFINEFIKNGQLQKNVQIYFDTPLGNKILNLYTEYSDYYSDEFRSIKDPFGLQNQNLHLVKSSRESQAIRKKRGVIIVAGGGMLDGGRAVTHLFNFIDDPKSTIAIVGYQADGTLGKELISRPKTIFNGKGRKVEVKINIEEVNGFSAHGDQSDLLSWVKKMNKENIKKIFLTHSEIPQAETFKSILEKEGYEVEIPSRFEGIEL